MREAAADRGRPVVLITGATDGIGKATARALATGGATVVLAGRNPDKTAATVAELARSSSGPVHGLVADLGSLAQVRDLAGNVRERYDRLDVLVNNAGAVFTRRAETVDGYERTLAVNHLAPFLLTNLLLDRLVASATARVVTVSSAGHKLARLDLDDLHNRRRYRGMQVYAQTKLANLLFTYELARRLKGTGVTANALHPGGVASNFGAGQPGLVHRAMRLTLRFGLSPEQSAGYVARLAVAPEIAGITGGYFDRDRPARSSPASYDEDLARRLWHRSAELVGLPAAHPTPDPAPGTSRRSPTRLDEGTP